MSAPSIPNLNTLRRGRGGLRGRARAPRGYPSGGDHPHDSDSSQAKDRIILGTDNDASVSRLSAVELGYLEDPFARAVAPSTSSPSAPSSTTGPGAGVRRLPIINRGLSATPVCNDTSEMLTGYFRHLCPHNGNR